MPTPGEHKTVQSRILAYAESIGRTFVSRAEAERRRGFASDVLAVGYADNPWLTHQLYTEYSSREFLEQVVQESLLPVPWSHRVE